jgi:hypothetical protein
MEYSVIMSGFGGQGVLMMGELLAHCGMKADLNVTWMPSYGVEMRGGTANCTVVISKEKIGAPVTGMPQAVIAMSEPALNKFKTKLPADGLLMVNSSLVSDTAQICSNNGITTVMVPTRTLAAETGNEKWPTWPCSELLSPKPASSTLTRLPAKSAPFCRRKNKNWPPVSQKRYSGAKNSSNHFNSLSRRWRGSG